MGPDNLAIVFAPTLMRSPDADPMLSLMNAQFEQKALETMILCFRDFFAKVSSQTSVDLGQGHGARKGSSSDGRLFDRVWNSVVY